MGKYTLACLIIFALQLSSLLNTLACPYCTYPTPESSPPPPPKSSPKPPSSPVVKKSPPPSQYCPIDTLKLHTCVDLLGGLVHIGIGQNVENACCPLLRGLADVDAALCLCTTIKARALNVNVILPIALQVLINCGCNPPSGFQCPPMNPHHEKPHPPKAPEHPHKPPMSPPPHEKPHSPKAPEHPHKPPMSPPPHEKPHSPKAPEHPHKPPMSPPPYEKPHSPPSSPVVNKSPPPPPTSPVVKKSPPPPPPSSPVVKKSPPPPPPSSPVVKKSPPPPPPSSPVVKKSPPPPPPSSPVVMKSPPPPKYCPIDTLKLHTCVDLLGGLVHIGIGQNVENACCPVLRGLADFDAALCLCTTIKARVLNINAILPVALQVLINCGCNPPSGFQCPP